MIGFISASVNQLVLMLCWILKSFHFKLFFAFCCNFRSAVHILLGWKILGTKHRIYRSLLLDLSFCAYQGASIQLFAVHVAAHSSPVWPPFFAPYINLHCWSFFESSLVLSIAVIFRPFKAVRQWFEWIITAISLSWSQFPVLLFRCSIHAAFRLLLEGLQGIFWISFLVIWLGFQCTFSDALVTYFIDID